MRMNDTKATKTKLYTFDEMKSAVTQAIAEMAQRTSACDDDLDKSIQMAIAEMIVGAKILTELDKKHEKGEL